MQEKITLKNLEALRKVRNITIDDLMAEFGYSRDTYYKIWQTGNIKAKDLIRLHNFFGVSVDCLLDITPIRISG